MKSPFSKTYVAIIVMSAVTGLCETSCSKNDPTPGKRCQKSHYYDLDRGDVYTFVRCCTQAEFDAKGDVSKGGTVSYNKNLDYVWEKCDQCK